MRCNKMTKLIHQLKGHKISRPYFARCSHHFAYFPRENFLQRNVSRLHTFLTLQKVTTKEGGAVVRASLSQTANFDLTVYSSRIQDFKNDFHRFAWRSALGIM